MEVLFVENAPGFGGSLTGILPLVEAFPDYIHPTLACPFDPREFVDVPRRLRIEVVSIDRGRINRRPTDSVPKALLRFAWFNVRPWMREVMRIGRKYNVDVIHANNLVLGNFGAALAAARLRCPILSHQKGYEHDGRLVRKIVRGRWYTHHIATSHSIAEHLLSLGVPPERCTMIYDAVVPPDQTPARRVDAARPVVAMHSVLRESKGQEVFLRAAARAMRSAGPFQAVVAGAPPERSDYPERLRRLASELGIADRVEFPGHVRDVYGFLAGVDVSVHASVEPEPFGRVVAESMMMGVPVVAASGSGAAEYVESSGAGWTTPPGDVDSLADALVRLLAAPDVRRRLGEAGQAYARREFAPRAIADQVVALYEDVVARRTPRVASGPARSNAAGRPTKVEGGRSALCRQSP